MSREASAHEEWEHRRATEAAGLRGLFANLAGMPEWQRSNHIVGLLRGRVMCNPSLTSDECLAAAYGLDGARAFWAVECSEPIRWNRLVDLLTIFALEQERGLGQLPMRGQWEAFTRGVATALFGAKGEQGVFTGDTTSLDIAQHVSTVDGNVVLIHVRRLAEWLLSKPKRRHVVPEALAAVVREEAEGEPTGDAASVRIVTSPDCPAMGRQETHDAAVRQFRVSFLEANGRLPERKEEKLVIERKLGTNFNKRAYEQAVMKLPADMRRKPGKRVQ